MDASRTKNASSSILLQLLAPAKGPVLERFEKIEEFMPEGRELIALEASHEEFCLFKLFYPGVKDGRGDGALLAHTGFLKCAKGRGTAWRQVP